MRLISLLISTFLLVTTTFSIEANECKVNGCGSGWSADVIPDTFQDISFKRACDIHDECYGRCIPDCGVNFGTRNCAFAGKALRRAACDTTFLQDMNTDCLELRDATQRKKCAQAAGIYFAAVRKIGFFFHNGQIVSDSPVAFVPIPSTGEGILAQEAQKFYLEGKTSETIEALKNNNPQSLQKLESLLQKNQKQNTTPKLELKDQNKDELLEFLKKYDASKPLELLFNQETIKPKFSFESLDAKTRNEIFKHLQNKSNE